MASRIRAAGFEAEHVIDAGIRGQPDDKVLTYARQHSMVLVTGDLGFSNVIHYPLGSHSGIVVARFPNEISTELLNGSIVDALSNLLTQGLTGALAIIEPGKVRLRKP